MWETLDQEILPLIVTSADMEITSLSCAEMSSQANIGQEFFLFDFDQDIQNNLTEYATSGCTEHLFSEVDDASVFQDLKYLISEGENIQGQSTQVMASGGCPSNIEPAFAKEVMSVPPPPSSVTSVNEKQIMELHQQDHDLVKYLNLSAEQLDHFEEFHDLNLLLEQVSTHGVLESIQISTKDADDATICGGNSDGVVPYTSSGQRTSGSSSSEPPRKKQKGISTSFNENTCEVSSTRNEKSELTPETTHQKYMEMRRKNNIASKRSRQIRKDKDKAMEGTVIELESENKVLKQRAEQLEKQRDALKNYVMTLITSQSSKVKASRNLNI